MPQYERRQCKVAIPVHPRGDLDLFEIVRVDLDEYLHPQHARTVGELHATRRLSDLCFGLAGQKDALWRRI
jgi:hypothetical protein